MGLDTLLKLGLKIVMFVTFVSTLYLGIDTIFALIPSSAGFGGCIGHFVSVFGLVESLNLFLKILVIGFVIKQMIAYYRTLI